jgi:hypothetical protein
MFSALANHQEPLFLSSQILQELQKPPRTYTNKARGFGYSENKILRLEKQLMDSINM